jgi:predicted amidophosphoribosyltransferase
MKCSGCQREFDETRIPDVCKGCPSGGGCHNVRCPYCGYETPREPGLVKAIRKLFKKAGRETKP